MREEKCENIRLLENKYNNHAIIVNKGKIKLVSLLDNGETSISSHDRKVKRIEFSRQSEFK